MIYHIAAGEELVKKMIKDIPTIVPFNEDMSVGEYDTIPFSESFIEQRSHAHKVSKELYLTKLRPVLNIINKINKEDIIHLYFGEDQTCLANRSFLISYFKGKVKEIILHIMDEYKAIEINRFEY